MDISRKGTVETFLKEETLLRVSEKAVEATLAALDVYGTSIAEMAKGNAQHAGRVTIQDSDIELAVSQLAM